jgi:hypothetical protein
LLRFLKTMAIWTAPAVPWDSPMEPFRYRVRQPGAAAAGCDAGVGLVAGAVVADGLGEAVTVTV